MKMVYFEEFISELKKLMKSYNITIYDLNDGLVSSQGGVSYAFKQDLGEGWISHCVIDEKLLRELQE